MDNCSVQNSCSAIRHYSPCCTFMLFLGRLKHRWSLILQDFRIWNGIYRFDFSFFEKSISSSRCGRSHALVETRLLELMLTVPSLPIYHYFVPPMPGSHRHRTKWSLAAIPDFKPYQYFLPLCRRFNHLESDQKLPIYTVSEVARLLKKRGCDPSLNTTPQPTHASAGQPSYALWLCNDVCI